MGKRIVVIGGVACGMKTAARAKRLDPSCEITVLERDSHISYGACGLPFYLEGEFSDIDALVKTPVGVPRDVAFFRAVKGVDVRIRTEAVRIDRTKKVVQARDLDKGTVEEIPYDRLVIATGSRPVRPPIQGIDLPGVNTLKTLHDGEAIKSAMAAAAIKKAVVVGAGLIGMECVEPLLANGFEIHVVEKLPFALPALLDEEIGAPIMKHLAAKGVRLHFGDGVVRFEDDGAGRVGKVVTEKAVIDAGLVILAIGFRPETEIAREAGLDIGQFGIRVDARMRTSDPDIFAGGDCVESRFTVTGRPIYAPMGSTANKHGRVIGENLTGRMSTFPGVCGTAVCRILGMNVARTGLTERDAVKEGLNVVTAIAPGPDKPHYMKDARPIILKLVAEAYSGRLLGAQIVGPGEVLSRIDTVAALISMGGTIQNLADVDMAYAPPFSPALDNIIVAAHILQNKLDGGAPAYSPKELKAKLDAREDFVLLDVRTPKEIEEMKLPYENVVHIPLGKLRERAAELPGGKEVVPFCKISLRGYEAQRILVEKGLQPEKVKFLDGGIVAWPYEKTVKG